MTFWETIVDALGAARYSYHALCLKNDPVIILLYVVGNLTTAMSCIIIGVTLYYARNVPARIRPTTRVLYGVFIVLCGLSNITEVITIFSGVYRLDVIIAGTMAAVSATMAVVTFTDVTGAVET